MGLLLSFIPLSCFFIKELRFLGGKFACHRDFQHLSYLNLGVFIKFIIISLTLALLIRNSYISKYSVSYLGSFQSVTCKINQLC